MSVTPGAGRGQRVEVDRLPAACPLLPGKESRKINAQRVLVDKWTSGQLDSVYLFLLKGACLRPPAKEDGTSALSERPGIPGRPACF